MLQDPWPKTPLPYFNGGSKYFSPATQAASPPPPALQEATRAQWSCGGHADLHPRITCFPRPRRLCFLCTGTCPRCISFFGVAARGYVMPSADSSDVTHHTRVWRFVVVMFLPFSPSLRSCSCCVYLPGAVSHSSLRAKRGWTSCTER